MSDKLIQINFIERDDANVITVSWEKAAHFTYHQAVANIRIVGKVYSN